MGAFDDILGAPGAAPKTGAFDDILGPHAAAPPPVRPGNPIDRTIRHGVTQGLRNLGDFGTWASENPLARGVGAVLGTTERMGESGVSNLLDRAAGKKPRTNPIAGVMDPEGDPRVTHRLEHQEWEGPLAALNKHLPKWAQGSVPTGGARQVGLDLLTQTAHDPLTYVPGVDLFTIGSRLWRAAHAGEGVARAAGSVGRLLGDEGVRGAGQTERLNEGAARLNEHLRSNLTTSHDPLKGLHQSGLNITRSHEGGAHHLQAQREAQYAPVPDRQATLRQLGETMHAHGLRGRDITSHNPLGIHHPLGIHNTINHIPLDQRLALHKENKLTDAALWREGSPQARGQMRARGYQPTAADAALPSANLVQGDYGRRYIPEQSIQDQAVADEADAARGFSVSKGGVKRSKFDAPKHGGPQNLGPLDERFANRLQSSAYLEPKRRAEQSIIRDLGLTPSQAPRTDARIAELQGQLDLTPKAKAPDLFRHQYSMGAPEVSPIRGGTFFTQGEPAEAYGFSNKGGIGGKQLVKRVNAAKNPLDLRTPESIVAHHFAPGADAQGIGRFLGVHAAEKLRAGKPTAANLIRAHATGDEKTYARYLRALGLSPAEVSQALTHPTASINSVDDRIAAELAKKHGHDAIIANPMPGQPGKGGTNSELFALHPSAHEAPRTSNPQADLLARHIAKYKGLHERQTAAAYKDALLREKHLNPRASIGDQKLEGLREQLRQTPVDHPDREGLEKAVAAHENPLSGVLRGKKTAERIAARDVAFHGGDASAAFNEEGKALGHVSTGASGEKARQRRVAATGAQTRADATQSALRDLDSRLSKMGLKQQKKVTKKIAALRTRQALRDRRNLGSLENVARPKVRAAPETPNIFDLPNLSNRKLTHELPASSPVMKRVGALRDERARRGGKEFAPLLHALPTDTTKATGKVHRLADRAERDLELKNASNATAAAAHHAREARNAAVSQIEQGVGSDPLYGGNVGMPSPLHERLFGPKVHTEPGVFQGVGRGIKSAMFTWPGAHAVGNEAEQQVFAGGGLGTLARGMVESVKLGRKDPAALARMNFTKQHGATHEHGFEHRVPQWNPVSKWLNQGLTLSHEGQTSALMDKYIKDGLSPADAAEEVRKTFGRPHEQAKEVKKGEAAGGLFWNWLLGTVPRSAKKMMGSVKSRNNLKQFARVDEDANADVFEPEYGVEWNPGGFASRAASLAIRPAAYFGGESMDTALHETAAQGKRSPWDAAKGYVPFMGLSNLAPGSQVLTDAQRARGGYKKLPEWAKMMSLGGSYFTRAETPHAKLMRELKREGLMRSR
jgi:hypothetical protein